LHFIVLRHFMYMSATDILLKMESE